VDRDVHTRQGAARFVMLWGCKHTPAGLCAQCPSLHHGPMLSTGHAALSINFLICTSTSSHPCVANVGPECAEVPPAPPPATHAHAGGDVQIGKYGTGVYVDLCVADEGGRLLGT
jgi:hypothetical protein